MDGLSLPGMRGAPAMSVPFADSTSRATGDASQEGALLDRARAGDRDAFGVLVDRHARTLAAVLVQRFGPRAPVEDLLQEVFVRTLRSVDGFEGRSSFLTWACSIAINLGTDWVRKEARRRRLAPMQPLPDDDGAAAPQPGPSSVAAVRDEARRARAALRELPEPHRLAVTLRVVESRDYDEIAARLDISPQLARTWVSRGVKSLRRMLREEDA